MASREVLRFDVFGQLQSRRHLEDSERWMLAGECLRAFQSCLELYDVADEEEKIIPIKTSSNRGQFNDMTATVRDWIQRIFAFSSGG